MGTGRAADEQHDVANEVDLVDVNHVLGVPGEVLGPSFLHRLPPRVALPGRIDEDVILGHQLRELREITAVDRLDESERQIDGLLFIHRAPARSHRKIGREPRDERTLRAARPPPWRHSTDDGPPALHELLELGTGTVTHITFGQRYDSS